MNFAESSLSERQVKDWIAQSVEHLFREKLDELLSERLTAFVKENEQRARELSLMERVVRVEEELRALKEIQIVHFQASEKRFEAMDKRFESLQREMIARFEAVDKRFEAMDKRFESLQREMIARFEAVDKRFEATDKRFEAMQRETNARFEAMDKRFFQLQWTIGLGFGLMAALMGTLRFLG
ncbi:MAG: hypothetical protein WHS46_06040 [Desulfosoma sp.]